MAVYPTINKLPLDVTGNSPQNRIVGERHKISAVNGDGFNFFIPDQSPFYGNKESFKLYDEDEGRYLNEGVDFFYTHLFTHAIGTTDEHKPVFGSITFINKNFDNNIIIDYNALGGSWSLDQGSIYEIIANHLISPFDERWENIVGKPLKFPSKDHTHDIQTDFTGFDLLIDTLNKLILVLKENKDQPDLTEIYKSFRDLIANSIKPPISITGETTNRNDGVGHTHKIDRASYTSYGITKFADKASDKDEYIGLTVTSSLLYKHAFFRDRVITLADDLNEKYLNRVYGAYAYCGKDRTISNGLAVNTNGNHPVIVYTDENYLGVNGVLFILPHIDGSIQYLLLDNGAIFLRRCIIGIPSSWIMLAAAGGSTDINEFFEIVNQLLNDVKVVNDRMTAMEGAFNNFATKDDIVNVNNSIVNTNNNLTNAIGRISKLEAAYIFKDELVTGQMHIGQIAYLNPIISGESVDFTNSIGYRRYMNSNVDVINMHPDFSFEKSNTAVTTISGIIFTYPANNCLQEQIITNNGYIYFRIRNYNNLYSPSDWICISWPSVREIQNLKNTVNNLTSQVLNISSNLDAYINQYMETNYDKIINDVIGKITIPTMDVADNYLFNLNDFINAGEEPTAEDIEKYKKKHKDELVSIEVANQLEEIINRSFVPFKGKLNQIDLNTLKGNKYGEYHQDNTEFATEALHYPHEDNEEGTYSLAGSLKVLQNSAFGDDSCRQLYFPYKTSNIYTRFYLTSTNIWSEWEAIGANGKPGSGVGDIEYIYPNGTEDKPYKIIICDEFVLKDPYQGKAVIYVPEIKLYNNDTTSKWVTVNYQYSNLESVGINVERSSDGLIYIKAGNSSIYTSNLDMIGGSNAVTRAHDQDNADFRIAVYKFVSVKKSVTNIINGNNIPNNSLSIGEFKLFPFRSTELPFGWYFRNGDNYLLDSPQGQALLNLSDNYKADHNITIKIIDEKQYINVPTAFYTDGRGVYERAVNGTNRQVGSVISDYSRSIKTRLLAFLYDDGGISKATPYSGSAALSKNNAPGEYHAMAYIDIDTSKGLYTGPENKVLDIGMTPAIYLGV